MMQTNHMIPNYHHNSNEYHGQQPTTSVTPQPKCFSWNPYQPGAPKVSHHAPASTCLPLVPNHHHHTRCPSDSDESHGTSLQSGSEDTQGVSSWDVSTTSSYGNNAPAPTPLGHHDQVPAYQMEIPAFKMARRSGQATAAPQQPRGHFVPPCHAKDCAPAASRRSIQAPLMHHKPGSATPTPAPAAPPLRKNAASAARISPAPSAGIPDVSSLSVPQWVHYVRSITQDDRMKEIIEGLGAPMQVAMLDSILVANEEEHGQSLGEEGAAFRNHCVRDRGNVIIFLLGAVLAKQPSAQHKARLQEHYSPMIVSHLLAHWTPIVTSQFGVLAVPRLRVLLNKQGQEAVASHALTDVIALGCNQYGNYILKDIIKMAACANEEDFDFVFSQLAAELSLPGRFAQLAQSRYGSHIIEAFLESAPRHHRNGVCDAVLEAAVKLGGGSAAAPRHNLIVSLGYHKQANYALQAVFKAIEVSSAQEAVATAQVLPLLQGSSFYRYLVKALKKSQKK